MNLPNTWWYILVSDTKTWVISFPYLGKSHEFKVTKQACSSIMLIECEHCVVYYTGCSATFHTRLWMRMWNQDAMSKQKMITCPPCGQELPLWNINACVSWLCVSIKQSLIAFSAVRAWIKESVWTTQFREQRWLPSRDNKLPLKCGSRVDHTEEEEALAPFYN